MGQRTVEFVIDDAGPDKAIATAKSGSFPLHTKRPLRGCGKHETDRAAQFKMAAGVTMPCKIVRRGVNARSQRL